MYNKIKNMILYFKRSYDRRTDKYNFISYDGGSKIIVAKNPQKRGGFFLVKEIRKETPSYCLVSLGDRQPPYDIYEEINLEEFKNVLTKFSFDMYEANDAIFAYHPKKHIWIKATYDTSIKIAIIFPNVLGNYSWRNKFGKTVKCMNINRVILNIGNDLFTYEPLTRLCELIIETDKKIFTSINNELILDEVCSKEEYEKLPREFKCFIKKNTMYIKERNDCK